MTTAFAPPFRVEVPATTANLGPGFDCLGMALDLWNTVTVWPSASPEVVVEGEGADLLAGNTRNLVYRAALHAADRLRLPLPPLRLEARNAIPLARGLGSSAAAAVAGLMIANRIAGGPLDDDGLLALAVDLEGHPDNAAPAIRGGACLVVQDGERHLVRSLPVKDGLTCVVFIPSTTLATKTARAVLPRRVSREDAVFNASHTALLVRALLTGEWDDLRVGVQDRLHQPYRSDLLPAMEPLFQAATRAGAYGAFLSGAGPTILALASPDKVAVVASALESEARAHGWDGRSRVIPPAASGARIISLES
jgi:homoserine kinase